MASRQTIPQNIPISCNILPTFHMNNSKPWAPPLRKPFSPHESVNSRSPRTSNLPRPKPRHDSFPSTLPLPKHHLPVRPPAEVCVHISTKTRPCTPLSSQFQPQEISVPPLSTPYSENPKQGTTSPHDQAPYTSNSDPISPCDLQEITDIPIEPPFFRGDTGEDGLLSPSISSSDDSSEEFFRLQGLQSDVPIDPAILANNGPWEASNLHQTIPQGDSLIVSETICPYPEPPPVLHNASDYHRDSGEGAGSQDGDTQTSDHHPIHGHQQLHSSHHNTDRDVSSSNGANENSHIGGQSKTSKRKTQRSDRPAPKRLRVPSVRDLAQTRHVTLPKRG
jgi:hypothetical protein